MRVTRKPFVVAALAAAMAVPVAASAPAAAEEVMVDGIPHVRNGARPSEGTQTLALEELWRVGGEDDEILYGAIGAVLTGPDGNVYLLDRQLSEVKVVSPDGEYLRCLSREGDGPGEVRRPREILFLPDGTLGITQMFPGRVIRVTLDDIPAGSIIPGGPAESGRMGALFSAKCRGGTFVACGEEMTPQPGAFARTRYLSRLAEDGTELERLLENSSEQDLANFVWDEEEDYFVHTGGMALGPDGRLYIAPERDRYEIHVYDPDGKLERVIERDLEPRKRTQREKDIVNDTRRMVINGVDIEKRISDKTQAIRRLWVDDESRLWVEHGSSDQDLPDGVLLNLDVFDPRGRFVHEVAVACPGDPADDQLTVLGDGRAVVVTGAVSAAVSLIGARGDTGDDDDESALEVICYRLPSL